MSIKKIYSEQPKVFKFSEGNLKKAEEILRRYPKKNKKSAVMPLLYLAQNQNQNWIPLAAMKYIAQYLSTKNMRVDVLSRSNLDRQILKSKNNLTLTKKLF